MTKEFPKKKPHIQIDLNAVAFNFGAITQQLLAMKKQAKESGEAIVTHMQVFNEKQPFSPADQVMHALAICLNTMYHGQAKVRVEEHMPTNSTMFMARVRHAGCNMKVTNEFLYFETGDAFEGVLQQMCDEIDKSGVIIEHVFEPETTWKMDSTEPFMLDTIKTVPVKGTFDKLKKSGIVNALKWGLNDTKSVKGLTVDDIASALKEFKAKVDLAEKQFAHIALEMQKTEAKMAAMNEITFSLEKKMLYTGGWLGEKRQEYGDSGVLLAKKIPGILELAISPCKCGRGSDSIHNIIIHLNDASHHGMSDKNGNYPEGAWTREQIADWTETLDTNLEVKEEV